MKNRKEFPSKIKKIISVENLKKKNCIKKKMK